MLPQKSSAATTSKRAEPPVDVGPAPERLQPLSAATKSSASAQENHPKPRLLIELVSFAPGETPPTVGARIPHREGPEPIRNKISSYLGRSLMPGRQLCSAPTCQGCRSAAPP